MLHLTLDTLDREVRLYVPTTLNRNVAAPLVLFWHGWTETCTKLPCKDSSCGWWSEAEARGIVVAIMCGWGDSFNAGTCCPPAIDMPGLDDVAFARAVVANLSAATCIDTKRVFSAGFSNGAMMSEILACEAWDLVKAVASIAGVVEYRPGNAEGITECDARNANSSKSVPVLGIHGTSDAVVPWDGDPLFGFVCTHTGWDGAQICNTEAWLRRYGCSNTSTVPWAPRGPFAPKRWADCPGGATVELVTWTGGSHSIPMTADFNATAYVASWLLDGPGSA